MNDYINMNSVGICVHVFIHFNSYYFQPTCLNLGLI